MIYLRLFNNHSDYEAYRVSEDFVAPNVSACIQEYEAHFTVKEEGDKDYFRFVARENSTFSFSTPIEYSLDSGATWMTLAASESTPAIAAGDEVMWRHVYDSSDTNGIGTFSATGNFDAKGNAMSLLYGSNFETHQTTVPNRAFRYLFSGNTHLISAEEMLLPANQLGASSYDNMFFGCTSLTTPPELPAERLANYCYRSMFEECTSMTTVPELLAEYVYEGSYQYMFYNCTSLTTVQEKLPAILLDVACYDSMYEGCTNIVQAPELPADELVSQCYNHMFNGCSKLNSIKAEFITTPSSNYTHEWVEGVAATGSFLKGYGAEWDVVGINGVPSGWAIITFDTTALAFSCKEKNGCTFSFTRTTNTPLYYTMDYGQTWSAYTGPISVNYNDIVMFKGALTATTEGIGTFGSTGKFNAYGNVLSLVYGDNFTNYTAARDAHQFDSLFKGCENLVEAHELVLPTTLTPYCYAHMFEGCTSIENKTPELDVMNLTEGCYSYMFKDCTLLYKMLVLPATTLAANCYAHMFEGCAYLTTVDELPAKTLVSGCYDYMFAHSGAWYVKALFTTEPSSTYTDNWLLDVYSGTSTFYMSHEATWIPATHRNPSGIPAYKDANNNYTWNVFNDGSRTRWVATSTYGCDDVSRYEVFKEQASNDGGQTWVDTGVQEHRTIINHSLVCGFRSGRTDNPYDLELLNSGDIDNADLTFTEVDGEPNIKTDENGMITEFSYTTASDDKPVMFNGDSLMDTAYHPFTTGGKNFEIIFKCYADYKDQVYTHEAGNDGLVNILTVRGESGATSDYAYGFSFRFSDKSSTSEIAINGNYVGDTFHNKKVQDDGSHMWYWKVTYIDNVFTITNLKNNTILDTRENINFGESNTMSVVLAAAVRSDGSYYRIAKCKFMEFSMKTLVPAEPQYRWHAVDIANEYICDNGDKHYVEYYQVSTDEGLTWSNVHPEQKRVGELYETGSQDCLDYRLMYFTIESQEDNNDIYIRRSFTQSNQEYYSTDNGVTWIPITSGTGSKLITTLNSGQTVSIKCVTNRWGKAYNNYNNLYSTGNIEVYGNVMSLLYGDDFTTATTLNSTYNFAGLFFGTSTGNANTADTNTKLVSARNLVLPATTVTEGSYNGMFRNCLNLVHGPQSLPAETLYKDVYGSMFERCVSLVEAPEIMATTIATNNTGTMAKMFCMDRSSRVTAAMTKSPIIRITHMIHGCCNEMFKGNGSLSEVTLLTTSNTSATDSWLSNVASSGIIYKKSELTLAIGSVSGVPTGWTYIDISE